MRKAILGIGTLVIGGSLLLASCGSKGEVKRSADGKEELISHEEFWKGLGFNVQA